MPQLEFSGVEPIDGRYLTDHGRVTLRQLGQDQFDPSGPYPIDELRQTCIERNGCGTPCNSDMCVRYDGIQLIFSQTCRECMRAFTAKQHNFV